MYLQTSHSSYKLECYSYNLQGVVSFQTAISKNKFKPELVDLLYHKTIHNSIFYDYFIIKLFDIKHLNHIKICDIIKTNKAKKETQKNEFLI